MKILNLEQNTGVVFLLSLLLLFNFSFISAEVDTSPVADVFKVNSNIQYTKPCTNAENWCSSAATCNFTFYNKDNSIQANNVLATEVGAGSASLWQYNISQSETGLYKVDAICVDGLFNGTDTFYYQITGDGFNNSTAFYIIILALSLGIVVWGLSMRDPIITVLGSFGLYMVSLYILFNGIAGTKDTTYTWAIGLIILAIAMYVSTRSAYEMIENN